MLLGALDRAGAKDVVTLLNGEATKDTIQSEWSKIVARASIGQDIKFGSLAVRRELSQSGMCHEAHTTRVRDATDGALGLDLRRG